MKIYSETLNKLFDTEEQCIKAEEKYAEEQKAIQEEKEVKASAISKEKKDLAQAIELAETNLNKAYEEYELAKEKVKEILEKSNKEMSDILTPAKDAVRKAQEARYRAIETFNKKFGVYTTTYSGDKALRELRRATSWVNDIFNRFFW